MSYNTLRYEVADNILTLTLNRPDELNAFTVEMADELTSAFQRASNDDDVGRLSSLVPAGHFALAWI